MKILSEMDKKAITLKLNKFKWSTEPSGGDLTHELTVKITMTTDQRAEIEDLSLHFWEHSVTLAGTRKPEQGKFETETTDDDDKDLAD
jgi:hypothetical protein